MQLVNDVQFSDTICLFISPTCLAAMSDPASVTVVVPIIRVYALL